MNPKRGAVIEVMASLFKANGPLHVRFPAPAIRSSPVHGWMRFAATRRGPRLGAALALAAGACLPFACSEKVDPPVLDVSPREIALGRSDSAGVFVIRNAGGGTLHWSVESNAAWAVPEVTSGSLESDPATIAFAIAQEEILAGPPSAEFAIASNGGADTVRVRLWRALTAAPESLFLPDSLFHAAVVLRNEGDRPVAWSASLDAPWLMLNHDGGLLSARAETLDVRVARSGLERGTYRAQVRIVAGAYGEDTVAVAMSVGALSALHGHVWHPNTRIPVEDATVRLSDQMCLTDAEGAYRFAEAPAGQRMLRVEKPGFRPFEQQILLAEEDRAFDIELFSAQYRHAVEGRLVNSKDAPVAHASVTLLNPDRTPSRIMTNTDLDGRYALALVPDGERTIRFDHPLYAIAEGVAQVGANGDSTNARLLARPVPPPFLPDGPALVRWDCRAVTVEWPARLEETVAGYRVERALAQGDLYADVSGLLTEARFDDRDPALGRYRYRIRTVNVEGITGEASPERTIGLYPWALLLPQYSEGPDIRWGHSTILCPEIRCLYLYAGTGCESGHCGTDFRDLWELDLDRHAWQLIEFVGGPVYRSDHTAIYDRARHRMIVHGGRSFRYQYGLHDTWAFDLASGTWSELDIGGPTPGDRWGHAAVYDEARDRMVIYGGSSQVEEFGDVWAFDLNDERWQMIDSGQPEDPLTRPLGRRDCGYALVGDRGWMVIYGGSRGIVHTHPDAWAFDLSADAWVRLPDGLGEAADCAMIYDEAHHRVIAQGGRDPNNALPLTYTRALELDPQPHWVELDNGPVEEMPLPRFGQTAVYDAPSRAMIVCGGNLPLQGLLANEVWSFCLGQ